MLKNIGRLLRSTLISKCLLYGHQHNSRKQATRGSRDSVKAIELTQPPTSPAAPCPTSVELERSLPLTALSLPPPLHSAQHPLHCVCVCVSARVREPTSFFHF
ncbi:hypothetical protein J6590_056388 [Homalodisca vitripennis]|nr:hypothetical protein J6590_056388 [Homalodisca vitripennis]